MANLALSATDSGYARLFLLLLLLVGVALILTGCVIALFSLWKRQKAHSAYFDSASMESERT